MAESSRANYDSKGIHTGLAIGELFSSLELEMIANRKRIFSKAKETGAFRSSVMAQRKAYKDANAKSARAVFSDVLDLAEMEIGQAYSVGTATVDKTIDHYRKQGFRPAREPNKTDKSSKVKMIGTVVSALAGIFSYSQVAADRQLVQIAAQVNENAENLDEEIDRAQSPFLRRGIAGAINSEGIQTEMSAVAELTTRQGSHDALIQAENERAHQYRIQLVQISAHPSSCPLCAPWQGKILVNDLLDAGASHPDYPETLSEAIAAGLFHFNCRHNYIVYVPGYDRPDLYAHDKASPKETALRYAVEQEQRHNERMIRAWKRELEGANTDLRKAQAQQKIEEWQARQRALRDISKEEGVPFYRQYSREQVGGETKPKYRRPA